MKQFLKKFVPIVVCFLGVSTLYAASDNCTCQLSSSNPFCRIERCQVSTHLFPTSGMTIKVDKSLASKAGAGGRIRHYISCSFYPNTSPEGKAGESINTDKSMVLVYVPPVTSTVEYIDSALPDPGEPTVLGTVYAPDQHEAFDTYAKMSNFWFEFETIAGDKDLGHIHFYPYYNPNDKVSNYYVTAACEVMS